MKGGGEGGVGRGAGGVCIQTRGKNSDSNLHQLYWWIKKFDSVWLAAEYCREKASKTLLLTKYPLGMLQYYNK